jgi:hypothetical protein
MKPTDIEKQIKECQKNKMALENKLEALYLDQHLARVQVAKKSALVQQGNWCFRSDGFAENPETTEFAMLVCDMDGKEIDKNVDTLLDDLASGGWGRDRIQINEHMELMVNNREVVMTLNLSTIEPKERVKKFWELVDELGMKLSDEFHVFSLAQAEKHLKEKQEELELIRNFLERK